MTSYLEHSNLTVSNPDLTAKWLCDVFEWHIRWEGTAMETGRSVHVGTDTHYLALFSPGNPDKSKEDTYSTIGGLNHLAIVVDDLDATESRVKSAGFAPGLHQDYDPGKRFYFRDHDSIEFEVVSYQ